MSISPLEALAMALSIAAVLLTTARNILCWPVGLVSVLLYCWIFAGARLYSDALLQIVYAALQLYGWWQWKHTPADGPQPAVRPARAAQIWVPLALAVVGAGALGSLMSRTNAASPWLDATLTALSLVAQYWMARMIRANWLMWIAVDVVYVGLYWSRDLAPTAALYAGFVVMAGVGWWRWGRGGGGIADALTLTLSQRERGPTSSYSPVSLRIRKMHPLSLWERARVRAAPRQPP